jgi:hypothetical protein
MEEEELEAELVLREAFRRKQYLVYQKNPLAWAQDVLGEDPKFYKWSLHEGYENHKWDGSKDPIWGAWNCLAKKQWASLQAATGTSKTFSAARVAFWFLDCFEDALVVTSAPKESQLTLNLWGEISKIKDKMKEVRPYMYQTKLSIKMEGLNEDSPFRETHQMIGFVAGVGADEESATKAQGFHRKNMLFICEEMAGMNSAVVTAFKNTCTGENNLIFALGNPDSETDELHKFSLLPNVHDFRISAYDYPNVVLGKELYAGAVTRGSIERRRVEYGEDSALFQSRVRGMTPKDDENSLIRASWVDYADIHSDSFGNVPKDGEGYNGCGVDVAQSENRDKAAVTFFESNELVRLDEFECNNATHLAYNLFMADADLMEKGYIKMPTGKIDDYMIMDDCIGVDTVGIGVATLNAFVDWGHNVVSLSGGAWTDEGIIPLEYDDKGKEKPLYKFANLRSQMYWEAREDLRAGKLRIALKDRALFERLKKELSVIRFALSDNAVAVEKKEAIKKRLGGKSPNLADAFVYGNWVRKAYRLQSFGLPMAFGG